MAVSAAPVHHRAPAAWVHSAFATCVRQRESHNGADPNADGNLYGMQDARGRYDWARNVSRREQDYLAWRLWKRDGVEPWRPHDGC